MPLSESSLREWTDDNRLRLFLDYKRSACHSTRSESYYVSKQAQTYTRMMQFGEAE
jgi:hypothetical protein